ncbi:MAG: 3-hydroxybenzoate 6-monooxygenase [Alphaproteobacteria bacterium]|jgi:3-hydroxybenzoate 6-monooxygenase|nr:3-hydroxybenzoate 6-monooxygenase [Alphaproteobacteria bacterium]MBT4017859.1 3-hydroxybenzoate 6-monooxygenase [Alphaproteobacteria bacterium]MBT4965210.1 3-hydroxybenzoate 6-monooxygenase [Alphaproteobacteria bacterium]MBT5159695.1 3-hydroxybenzoate 6-monooxygenase [Alphaproteobacteria bacterium]MBT6384589.1 3-hydroxybenzoate 6-monooxygenase [Alphaproteobacteria bacterium]
MSTNNAPALPVLIVGGGIGGLAVAVALSKKGIASQVLEQSEVFAEIGAGIQLGPNVFRAFRALGVYDAVCDKAVFVDDLIMMDSVSGTPIKKIPLGETIRERFKDPYAVIHRADLHQAFVSACEASALITLTTNTSVESYAQAGDVVTVTTKGGNEIKGCAVIGADGLWSSVRAQMHGNEKPRVSGHIAYRAVLPIDEVPESVKWNAATLWAGPRNHLVHYPLRNWELFNLVAVFHSDRYEEGWNAVGAKDEMMRCFEGVDERPMSMLKKVDSWRMWVLCDRDPIEDWSDGRVTLLGDAAHPMLQYFAQGACMASEDAVCLANMVEQSEGDFTAAFLAYQKTRYLRTARVQMTARFLGDVYHAAGPVRELRNMVFGGITPEDADPHAGLAWLYGGGLSTAG